MATSRELGPFSVDNANWQREFLRSSMGPCYGYDLNWLDGTDNGLTFPVLLDIYLQAQQPLRCSRCRRDYCHHSQGRSRTRPLSASLQPSPGPSEPTSSPSDRSTRSSTHLFRTLTLCNEFGPLPRSQQEMESSGAGALALHAAPLPDNPYMPHDRLTSGETMGVVEPDFTLDEIFGPRPVAAATDTPSHAPRVNHFDASNVRASTEVFDEQQQQASPTSTNARFAATTLAMFNAMPAFDHPPSTPSLPVAGWVFEDGPEYFDEDQLHNMKAFAKLSFHDGDYFVTSTKVMVGRNKDYQRELVYEELREKKRQRAEGKALSELAGYMQEPSATSQPVDDDNFQGSSKSSHSLEGRPAKALPSNYSEQGGAVTYAVHSDDEEQRRKGKGKARRKQYKSYLVTQSSSTTSVAPANLHPSMSGDVNGDFALPDPRIDKAQHAFVPIHPEDPEEINLISKNHLMIRYDTGDGCWLLDVLGSWVSVNEEQLKRNDTVRLNNMDRIQIFSVEITFKLPVDNSRDASPGLSHGYFAEDLDDELDERTGARASSLHELSDAEEGVGKAQEVDAALKKRKVPTLKLGKKKKDAQEKDVPDKDTEKVTKARKKKEVSPEHSPEATKTPDMGKKPKAAAKEPAEAGIGEDANEEKAEKASSPSVPINIQPGSVLAGLAPDQLPQKRKGPGRPPKNGLISKRDEAFIKRKQKELEKQGLPIPTMDELLAQVRAENKAREAMQKAIANGQPPPADMAGVMQSIELDPALQSGSRPSGDATVGMATHAGADLEDKFMSATPGEALRRPSSPKPKRVAQSPSPIPPESHYTEEQLKKPTQTYVHILDEILHDIGKGDLQEIYDKILKKYPHFKYRVNTPGWQSSVRHNLLQNPRFKEDGRSGKGRLWAINFDVPLEREKKRRVTPPQRTQMPMQQMQNGQWPPPHGMPYGQPAYGAYGQPGVPPQFAPGQQAPNGAYASPYAPHQGYSMPPVQQSMPPHGHQGYAASGTPVAGPSQAPHRQQGSATPGPPSQFQGIVDEIMDYRSRYLQGYHPNSAEFLAKSELFSKCTNFVSNRFHGVGEGQAQEEVQSEEERLVCRALDNIMTRWEHLKGGNGNGSAQGTPAAAEANSSAANGAVVGAVGDAATQSANAAAAQPGAQAPAPEQAVVMQRQAPAQMPFAPTGESQHRPLHVQAGPSMAPPTAEGQAVEQPSASAPPAEVPAAPQIQGTKRAADDEVVHEHEQEAKRTRTDDHMT